jgi:hypothetical protein
VSLARKPVVVRKFTRDWCAGYAAANPGTDLAELELLDTSGKLLRLDWDSIKWVCYVREPAAGSGTGPLSGVSGSGGDAMYPERLIRRKFTARPRSPGLWLRMTLQDGDELEGIAANDRSLLEGSGLLLTPPDTRSNTQRVFVPRTSIREFTVVAVLGPARLSSPGAAAQPSLFASEPAE